MTNDGQWAFDHLAQSGIPQPDINALLQPYGVSGNGQVIRFDVLAHNHGGTTASMEVALERLRVKLVYDQFRTARSEWRIESVAPYGPYGIYEGSERRIATRYDGNFEDWVVTEGAPRPPSDEAIDVAFAQTSIALAEEVFNGMPPPDLEPPAPMTKLALILENKRLRTVIDAADDWRETLNLPQQDLGCEEFNMAWEAYDGARYDIGDLIPPRPTDED